MPLYCVGVSSSPGSVSISSSAAAYREGAGLFAFSLASAPLPSFDDGTAMEYWKAICSTGGEPRSLLKPPAFVKSKSNANAVLGPAAMTWQRLSKRSSGKRWPYERTTLYSGEVRSRSRPFCAHGSASRRYTSCEARDNHLSIRGIQAVPGASFPAFLISHLCSVQSSPGDLYYAYLDQMECYLYNLVGD